jgi:transmembrane sensor
VGLNLFFSFGYKGTLGVFDGYDSMVSLMAMPLHRITELILKHHRGTLLPEEQAELQQWQAGSERRQQLVRQLTDEEWLRPQLEHQDRYSPEQVWEKFEKLVPEVLGNSGDVEAPQGQELHSRRIGLRWAAAAILVIVAGAGGYLYFSGKPQPKIANSSIQHDAAPGRNAAILNIAGGQQILLDSTVRGIISRQGNTTVTNTKGQLAYTALPERPTEIQYNTLTTQRGNQYQLALPDGTKVWLNAASSITYPTAFAGNDRSIAITGEAYFEVRKNASQPFKVIINGQEEVEVLGTSFNVNAYQDEPQIAITLLEGSVSVRGEPFVGVNTNKGKVSLVLKPGQQAQLVFGKNSNNGVRVVNDVDVDGVVAWKDGKFRYSSVDIGSIMRQAARWYDLDVEYEGEIDETFSGGISRNVNASQLLHILEITKKVHFDIEGKKIIVKPVNAK